MQTKIRVALLSWLAVALATAAARADEPAEVRLLRPDSLAGWEYGPTTASGWKIAGGRLATSGKATPLLSGFSFGAFRLRFQWSTAEGGILKITLPEVPKGKGHSINYCRSYARQSVERQRKPRSGDRSYRHGCDSCFSNDAKGLELALREGDGCGRLADGDKTLAPGAKIGPAAEGKMHTATIDRAGGKLSVSVDGRRLYDVGIQPQRRFGLGLAVEGVGAALADLRLLEPPGQPIFNGRDLAGWWCPGNLGAWKAENNELILHQRGGNYIRTEKEFANFTLSLEYHIRKRGNSGVGIRTPRAGWPSGDGMELQIEDRPAMNKHASMAIYGNVPPIARADESEQWNRVVVKADGWMISAWVNGQLVQQCNTFHHPELKHRNLKGWIGFQDHGAPTRFRNIRVLEAPDGPGLGAWYGPRPPRATTAMLDRLMNPERLSADDGIRSGVAAARVAAEKKEHVLAELTGPGAVVRVARTGDEGRLAFYFDGQKKPRLECKPGNLRGALPPFSEDRNPVVTCLTYEKGLKIVLRDAAQADYRIDYVTFPAGVKVESFIDPHSGFPRGWLSAVEYRQGQSRWGAIRQHDPMPRFASEKKTIEPGKTEQLVHVDSAGIVQWLQLNANKQVVDTDDLWLEVTIDGEKCPAVSAPARFFFPGLAGQGNFGNFVMLRRGGTYNRLAMPFGGGITVAARNTGEQPIQGVGVTLCVQPATDKNRAEIAGRMRLRGVFQPAGEGTDQLACVEGAGRFIGLVYQQPDGPPTGIDALLVDGRAAPGWQSSTLDAFLGQGGEFRACLSGRHGRLAWRYLLLAPVDFQKSLVLRATGDKLGDRLVLYYAR